MNAIITVEERVPDFSLPLFPWKAMLRALVQESHLDLQGMGTLGFDWGIFSFCDSEDNHALFDCKMLQAQVQRIAKHSIIWIEREIVQKGDCMATSLCPPTVQSESSCNAISIGSRKDWDDYLQKCLGQVTLAPPSSVVIKGIIESLADLGSSDSGKGQALPAIGGFAPLVLALLAVTGPTSSSF